MLRRAVPLLRTLPTASLRPAVHLRTMSSVPKTMKAIQVEETGGPEKNVMNTIPVPEPKDDEVLLKVEWTGANYIDNYRRSGLYKLKLPFTQGQDVVGTIAALPKSASPSTPSLSLGQRVWAPAGASFAEYTTFPANKVVPLPAGVDPKDGVSMCTVALTAVTLVREAYAVQRGDWVLVRAAAGGVGLVLVQLCKHLGARVIATTSSQAKADLARENGADHVLLTTASSEENVKKINELTDGGVHVVYDGVGKDTWDEDFDVVRTGGTIVTFGNASGPVPAFSPLKLSAKCLKVTRPTLFPFIARPADFARHAKEVSDLAAQGVLRFRVHKVYPFTEEGVRQTQIDISGRGTTGKLLIHVAGDETPSKM